jgi:hypothetical protein
MNSPRWQKLLETILQFQPRKWGIQYRERFVWDPQTFDEWGHMADFDVNLLLLLFRNAGLSALVGRLPLGPKGQWASCHQRNEECIYILTKLTKRKDTKTQILLYKKEKR